jgi:hypothetical protein
MPTRREASARQALERLGADRFERFLQAVASDHPPRSVRMLLEALDSGETFEAAFFDGEEHGFTLELKRTGRNRFRVGFGYACPPELMAGDHTEWEVQFNDDRTVASATAGLSMIL